jgi:acyl-CoA-dependent ceramide synthase
MFGFFILSWFITRHVLYVIACYSVYTSTPRLITPACYHGPMDNLQGPFPTPNTGWSHYLEAFLDPASTVCWDRGVMSAFLMYLLFLQVMMIMWFVLIMRVAMRVLSGKGAEDVRSDSEAEQEEIEEQAQPFEEEVGVEALDLKGWERRTSDKRTAASSSSGVSLPVHSHAKELLNRIGCEKQID